MSENNLHWIANFIWGIADDVLRDVYVRGKYRDVILPMVVIRRLDAVLEPSQQAVKLHWGGMVGDARDYLQSGWWILAFAGGMIALAVLSFNFLGDGMRDALDPRTRHVGTARSAEEVTG